MAKKPKLPLYKVQLVHKIWGTVDVYAESMAAALAKVQEELKNTKTRQNIEERLFHGNDIFDSTIAVVGVQQDEIGY